MCRRRRCHAARASDLAAATGPGPLRAIRCAGCTTGDNGSALALAGRAGSAERAH